MSTAPQPAAICAICGDRVPAALLLGHLRGAHDLDIELATWPDGEAVIVDLSLEPDDFLVSEDDSQP